MFDIYGAWQTLKLMLGICEPAEVWLEKLEATEAAILTQVLNDSSFGKGDLFAMKKNQMDRTNTRCRIAGVAIGPRQNKLIVDSVSDEKCFQRNGIITSRGEDKGTIDFLIEFTKDSAANLFETLKVGYHVEYMAYKLTDNHIKLVRVIRIVSEFWDELGENYEEELRAQIAELQQDDATYFKTNERNIIGKIKNVFDNTIVVDTDGEDIEIIANKVDSDFKPKRNDCVCLECLVQIDENIVDLQGAILDVMKLKPTRIVRNVEVIVTKMYNKQAELGEDIYILMEDVPSTTNLRIDDHLVIDMVECMHGRYSWRCERIHSHHNNKSIDMVAKEDDDIGFTKLDKIQQSYSKRNIEIISEPLYIFDYNEFPKRISLQVKNTTNATTRMLGVSLIKRNESILRFIEPRKHVEISSNTTRNVIFEVKRFVTGKHTEPLTFSFNGFRFTRCIDINVLNDKIGHKNFNTNECKAPPKQPTELRDGASKIWNRNAELVPGVRGTLARRFVSCRIDEFNVPDELKNIYSTANNQYDLEDNIKRLYPCLRQSLKYANYLQRFRSLIHLEEINMFINFRNFDKERGHFIREGDYLSLTIENLAESRPSLCIGDTVRAIDLWPTEDYGDERCYEGVIQKVLCNRILLKFNSSFQSSYNGTDYRLEFFFSRYSIRKQQHAVAIVAEQKTTNFLFPEVLTLREKPQLDLFFNLETQQMQLHVNGEAIPWHNSSLNEVQKRAVYHILRGEAENMPYVIYGPPGTGKTLTVVETIIQLIKNVPDARIMVATPSNSAANLITQRIADSEALQFGDYVRIVSQSQIEKEAIPESLMPYCATLDIGMDATCKSQMVVTDSGMRLGCQSKYLSRRRIIIGTLSTVGTFMTMALSKNHFTHVIIDEAAQAKEPEAMIPIAMLTTLRGQVILAGDPNQLQPIIVNKLAEKYGLSLSFLERILLHKPYMKDKAQFPDTLGYNPQLVTKLIYNYRALPSIMNLYNELFYDSELISMVSESDSHEIKLLNKIAENIDTISTKSQGIYFCGILGIDQQGEDSPSWYNQSEAKAVFLMTIKLFKMGIEFDNIGIMSPYIKQVKYLRSLFTTVNIEVPKIGTVEEFQGQERDVILISTVRSTENQLKCDAAQSLGFVCNAKRMNVAVSRARALQIVFGNPYLLGKDTNWRALIKYCHQNGTYYGCSMPTFQN